MLSRDGEGEDVSGNVTVGLLVKRGNRGFTLMEILVVVVIIAILASLLLPVYAQHRLRANEVRCMANLRNLYVAASNCLQSTGSWPQIPVQLASNDPQSFARQWVQALTPYGATHIVWICPSIQTALGIPIDAIDSPQVDYRIDYMPVSFDDDASSPRKWTKYPWFVEKGASHSRGNLVVLADGSVVGILDLVPQ